jgi:hypothetical protein
MPVPLKSPAPITAAVASLDAQLLHLRLAQPEPAKDLGIVLPELWGGRAHPHIVADLDRGSYMRDIAQFLVGRVLDETAVAHLRVAEHLLGATEVGGLSGLPVTRMMPPMPCAIRSKPPR